jgi:hypothetical protein
MDFDNIARELIPLLGGERTSPVLRHATSSSGTGRRCACRNQQAIGKVEG